MAIPQEILQLVARFKQDSAGYREGTYNETQLRIEFLNPFFKALGWDMDNSAKHSLAARDVLHEYSLKIEGRSKAPDYCFRAGGNDKFFVEAKKPAVNLENDPRPAFQTRVYGWNRGLSFCILTDFEEFAVYDCRFKPALTESAQTARAFYCRYEEYDKNWEKIAEWFGRDAVQKGAIEAAAALSAKKGSVTFDADFLKLIEGWRKALAENIVARNKALSLSSGDLNFAVQMTIDRILFLRMCEDRDIEPFEQLQKISQKKGVYSELLDLFFQADNIYNSGLFRFPPKGKTAKSIQIGDPLTPQLKIDDGVLESIIYGLYSPNPYNFRVMPVEILGQVYEQFLGKVIGLDKNKVCIRPLA